MIDQKRLVKAQVDGVCFLCRLCENWYKGEDRGLKNFLELGRCAAVDGCGSPLAGKSFHEYKGPLQGRLDMYCFMCGKSPVVGLRPKLPGAQRVGCCQPCFDKMKDHHVAAPGPEVRFISETKKVPDKFDGEMHS